ncbi:hypothetical protein SDJN03_18397, partial [Cucurbita argyrosperma subsp. sororia]
MDAVHAMRKMWNLHRLPFVFFLFLASIFHLIFVSFAFFYSQFPLPIHLGSFQFRFSSPLDGSTMAIQFNM